MTSRVITGVAGLGALTAAGQLIIIGSLPAYSKIFDPGIYGEYVIFVGTLTVISVFAGLRYDSAIVLPRNDGMAAALSALVMLIALTVAAVIAVATLAASAAVLTSYRWAVLEQRFGYGLAAATFISALQRCLTGWCVRSSRFLRIGWAQFAFCAVTVAAQLSLARVMEHLAALIWGYALALAVQTLCLGALGLGATRPHWARSYSLRALKVVARKYRRFPTYMLGYALASSMRDRLVQFVLGIAAGAAVVGRFGLAYRVTFAPNSLVYSAISPVFFGMASRGSKLAVGAFAANLVETTFVVLAVPYAAFACEASVLTDAVLSEKWHGTGPYLQALAGPALVLAATCWLDRAFDSFRRQNVAFLLEASFTVISVAVVASLARLTDPVAVAWVFGALAFIYYWTYFLVAFIACSFPMENFRRASRNGLIVILIVLLGAVAIHKVPQLAARMALYVALFGAVLAIWWVRLGGAATARALLRAPVGNG